MTSRDISMQRLANEKRKVRRVHQAKWDEPIIFELSEPGQRGLLPPEIDEAMGSEVGDVLETIPEGMRRKALPGLPELSQPAVLRHYLRLSQETLGVDFNIDVGQGTCTMKYNPKINDQLAASHKMAELHPLQPEETVQGILQVMYDFEQVLKEISGLDAFTLQPGAGSQAIYTNASIIRAYHASRGQAEQRNEIITTIFSHPSDAACPQVAGYHIITLYPDKNGYPSIEALKAAVSERTAGLMLTNPEDTGIFNPDIAEFVRIVHEAGGLASYDQANANGILGITRAKEAGFDLCHFNLHKTFSTPHGSGGPAVGATGVTQDLEQYLPVPIIGFDGKSYWLNYDRPSSIGKVRSFYGVAQVVLRAYAWVMSLGAEGLKEVAQVAVLNNNYLMKRVLEIPGGSAPYAAGKRRLEQVRYSWEKLASDTGISSEELGARAADYGAHFYLSHHPYIVPEPSTFEPTESYSQAELDEYAAIIKQVAEEAYATPDLVKTAPHNSTIHKINEKSLDDPAAWAPTWRAYLKKTKNGN